MKQSILRLVGVLAAGAFVLALVIGSLLLTRVDPMLIAGGAPHITLAPTTASEPSRQLSR